GVSKSARSVRYTGTRSPCSNNRSTVSRSGNTSVRVAIKTMIVYPSVTEQQKEPHLYQGRDGVPVVPPWLRIMHYTHDRHSIRVRAKIADTLCCDNGCASRRWLHMPAGTSPLQLPSPFDIRACATFTATGGSLNTALMCTSLDQRCYCY